VDATGLRADGTPFEKAFAIGCGLPVRSTTPALDRAGVDLLVDGGWELSGSLLVQVKGSRLHGGEDDFPRVEFRGPGGATRAPFVHYALVAHVLVLVVKTRGEQDWVYRADLGLHACCGNWKFAVVPLGKKRRKKVKKCCSAPISLGPRTGDFVSRAYFCLR